MNERPAEPYETRLIWRKLEIPVAMSCNDGKTIVREFRTEVRRAHADDCRCGGDSCAKK